MALVGPHGGMMTMGRCRVPCTLLRARPRGSGQHVLCAISDNLVAICRIAVDTQDSNARPDVDATVTLERTSGTFRDLEASLLVAHASGRGAVPDDATMLWIPRGAVCLAASVTLELVATMEPHVLQDLSTRSWVVQTLQRNVVICTDAVVHVATRAGLVARSKADADEQLKCRLTFRVVSTYPSKGFMRVTPDTRVTLTSCTRTSDKRERIEHATHGTDDRPSRAPRHVNMGGMETERAALRDLILLPLRYPRLRSTLELPSSLLLCGPPGVGKTLLVRSVLHECRQATSGHGAPYDIKLHIVHGAQLCTSSGQHEEDALRHTFAAARAHARRPDAASVVFLDELDALCPPRHDGTTSSVHTRLVAQLLTLLDGIDHGRRGREHVVVVAATNVPNAIDPALRRPGRLDRELVVSPPSPAARKQIFHVHLAHVPLALGPSATDAAPSTDARRADVLDTLAAKTVGYVGADIAALCREAVLLASTRQVVAQAHDRDLTNWWHAWHCHAEPLGASSPTMATTVAARAWQHALPRASLPLWYLVHDKRTTGKPAFSFLLGDQNDDDEEETHSFPPARDKDVRTAPMVEVTMADFDHAMELVTPSLLRSARGFLYVASLQCRVTTTCLKRVLVVVAMRRKQDTQGHGWDHIGGQARCKLALQQALEWPLRFPETFARLGVHAPRGLLLYGPPGCSKSSLARVAAQATRATFLSLSPAQVFSPFMGDAEAAVRQLFRDARAARPAVLFLDELDVLVAKRDVDGSSDTTRVASTALRVLSTLLNEMDGMESAEGLVVLGATNRPACLDAALLRPGRFDRMLLVDVPSTSDRLAILRIHTQSMPLDADVNFNELAHRTSYFSGAELENVCREAALQALRESLEATTVCMRHFDQALATITPVCSPDARRAYLDFAASMGHVA
ncbi:hypothetical protein PsorP6_005612 [Peronosclerospora sorghi]|uniref:Uncharacterized protein n=1 Tax=Peronosclerospora sorghi TaxID=230839 RepID=A0ACC0W6X4_9STRA|nr:hypothetical protein PsorP6_005612 [Peronosclerospora sorghi]